ncbi:MAG: hypothetical protein J5915_12645 [Acidaminococcaceae bacterium]|nr:hypothetical protein [Acidaminococcaceae bacterium]MBO5606218.1 hypothetical protein [Acidaminococcaceae bacterium]MBQ5345808.1 hypothetical protein [Acidaminococcaceae bacterium]
MEKSADMRYNKLLNFAGVTGDSDEPGLAGGEMDCLRCGSPMRYRGDDQLQLGKTGFFTGSLSNLLSGALDVAIFECPNCGKIEFFNPEIAVLPDGTNST